MWHDAAHWRMRAEELRTFADDAIGPGARATMLRIAADYDRLAKHSEDAAAVDALMFRVASDYDGLIKRPRVKQGKGFFQNRGTPLPEPLRTEPRLSNHKHPMWSTWSRMSLVGDVLCFRL
jgi:hypothetical protein